MPFAALALAALASAGAAPPSLPQNPPAVFGDYSHPEVSEDACKSSEPGQTVCFLPPKTMGRYLIMVAGTSTANGPDATQAIAIAGPGWVCGEAQTKKGEWTGGERTLVAQCVITVLSDEPLKIVASFGGANAKPSPAGPKVTIRPAPWDGVLDASNFQVGVAQPKAPPAK
jgi:hypothetical protein